ncbi:MAG: nascent polypeptide-associated complex protein [Candidatus Diapherotrites archaeon]|nr:nascent polypeptide-associated complex protein [Candidatus Diapherotrites archaeon]
MFPGMGNPKQMQRMMKQFGIKSEELPAEKVTIESSGKKIVINNPQITVIDMKGQKTYTIMGEETLESAISEEDVKMVAEQAGVGEEKARKALKEADGDIAEAITKLKE